MTFSPPKDVSALWATSSPYRRAQIEVAHRRAVASTLARTVREVPVVRRKHDGKVRFERARGLLAMESVHTTSRLARDRERDGVPDPQLHSHVAVIAAQRRDGRLAAVESRRLFLAARENGAWYRAELAANLRELGLPIARREGRDGRYFAIPGVARDLSERWSTRSEDVQRAAQTFRARYGREPRAGELDALTLGTRGGKSTARGVDVQAAWRAVGAEYGLTPARAEELFNDWGLRPGAQAAGRVDLRGELLDEVVRERAAITERELRAKAYELCPGVCRPVQAERAVSKLIRTGELVRLPDGTWTTRSQLEREHTTLRTVTARKDENAAVVGERALRLARREIGKELHGSLTREQREALSTITGKGGVTVLVGRAGTGKGVVLAAAARAWRLEDNTTIGTAIAGATAQRLREQANLHHAYTTDALINRIEHGRLALGRDAVVLMDEAGMADTKRLARLAELTANTGSKLVLVGDGAQLSPIGAGGLFKQIERDVPTAQLREVHRAQHEWERTAWEQIRAGEPGPALAQYRSRGRLHIHDTREQAARAMVENWDRTRHRTPHLHGAAVMITDASNKERDEINKLAQERRARAGELGANRVALPGKPYDLATGDEVMFTKQMRVPGQHRVENGITGTVVHSERDRPEVTVRTDEREPREVPVNTSEFPDLSLAYAVHLNKAQGLTAQTSGIMTGGWQTDREHAYVAASRARAQTQLYTSREDLGQQGMDPGAIERLSERFARTRAQQAAITKQRLAPERDEDTVPHERAPATKTVRDHDRDRERAPTPPAERAGAPDVQNIRDASPAAVNVLTTQMGDTKLAYSDRPYDLQGHTPDHAYTLFGGWQTKNELGFTTTTTTDGHEIHQQLQTEPREGRDIAQELKDRIEKTIEHAQNQQRETPEPPTPTTTSRDPQHAEPAHHPTFERPALAPNTPLPGAEPALQPEPAREPIRETIREPIGQPREPNPSHSFAHGSTHESRVPMLDQPFAHEPLRETAPPVTERPLTQETPRDAAALNPTAPPENDNGLDHKDTFAHESELGFGIQ